MVNQEVRRLLKLKFLLILMEEAEAYHTELVEKVAETTEELMNKYFEDGNLSPEDLDNGIKLAMIKRTLSPVFCMSASRGVGLNNFLDFASKYFPSPLDRGGEEAAFKDSDKKVSG
jgi:elongation factor G